MPGSTTPAKLAEAKQTDASLSGNQQGDAERERDEEDYSFTAQRQVVWAVQHVVFAAVMGDAAMLDSALDRDVYSLSDEAAAAARERERARVQGAGQGGGGGGGGGSPGGGARGASG